MENIFNLYTREVINYNLGPALRAVNSVSYALTSEEVLHHVRRVENLLAKSKRDFLVLFGVGNLELAGKLIAKSSEYDARLFLCDLNIERMRTLIAHKNWEDLPENTSLICDTSPRAIIALLVAAGVSVENSVFYLTPGLPEAETKKLKTCMQLLQRSQAINADVNEYTIKDKQISILAILHPEEQNLDEFCGQIPSAIKELVIVWDSPNPIQKQLNAACPIIQSNRNLTGDFAAQRNHALALCSAPWVLALDGDERLDARGWLEVNKAASQDKINAFFLERLTLFPDRAHFRAGFGLWPDYQMRLFRRTDKTMFSRAVHEILIGISGKSAILQHAPLWHLSYVLKDRESLEKRLQVFNEAMGKPVHRLSQEYPHLPLSWHKQLQELGSNLNYLVLPE